VGLSLSMSLIVDRTERCISGLLLNLSTYEREITGSGLRLLTVRAITAMGILSS